MNTMPTVFHTMEIMIMKSSVISLQVLFDPLARFSSALFFM